MPAAATSLGAAPPGTESQRKWKRFHTRTLRAAECLGGCCSDAGASSGQFTLARAKAASSAFGGCPARTGCRKEHSSLECTPQRGRLLQAPSEVGEGSSELCGAPCGAKLAAPSLMLASRGSPARVSISGGGAEEGRRDSRWSAALVAVTRAAPYGRRHRLASPAQARLSRRAASSALRGTPLPRSTRRASPLQEE